MPALFIHSVANVPPVYIALLVVGIMMTNKATLSVGPLQLTLYKPRKRRRWSRLPRRRIGR